MRRDIADPFASLAPIALRTSPKAPGSSDRTVRLEETFALLPQLRERFGITRVGNTSLLDRTAIPTACAVVPRSPDLISVYNGKGSSQMAATVSAVMEAVERQVAAAPQLQTVVLPVEDLRTYLNLDALGLRSEALPSRTEAVAATELLSARIIAVPLALAQCPWFGERLFPTTTSNGLASGNTLVEALYHALTELIERHVWSLFYVRSQLVPRFYLGACSADVPAAREIRFPTGNASLDELAARVQAAGMDVRVLVLLERGLPPVALASLVDPSADPPMAHTGLGCSLSPAHAAERALTECVQSRVVDIQAAREDILRAQDPDGAMGSHARRRTALPKGRWYFDLPAQSIGIAEIPDSASDDLARDVATIVDSLRAHGMREIAVIDLSPADVPVSVVRAIVPDAETTTIDGRIGAIARREFNPFRARSRS